MNHHSRKGELCFTTTRRVVLKPSDPNSPSLSSPPCYPDHPPKRRILRRVRPFFVRKEARPDFREREHSEDVEGGFLTGGLSIDELALGATP